jgi:hypothetical protein
MLAHPYRASDVIEEAVLRPCTKSRWITGLTINTSGCIDDSEIGCRKINSPDRFQMGQNPGSLFPVPHKADWHDS